MQNLEALVKNLKAMQLPMDALDTSYLTEDEKTFFYLYCRQYSVKHSEEARTAGLSTSDVASPIHY